MFIKSEAPFRIAIAGSVNSSRQTLLKLHEHGCDIRAVLGLDPNASKNVSGYIDLKTEGDHLGYNSRYFKQINDKEVVKWLEEENIDLLFVTGLSQLIKKPLIDIAKYGNIGFHPTLLPEGRGRGAVAWLVLGKAKGAASFFMIDKGMDSGPIIGQKPYEVTDEDYAIDVIAKIKNAIDDVLDQFLPDLKNGIIEAVEQDHSKATYLGRRKPIDGLIDWTEDSKDIHRLIRASSHPFPGAYSTFGGVKVIIWEGTMLNNYIGIPGRVIDIMDENPVVTCGTGAIRLDKIETNGNVELKIGTDLNT